MRPVVGRSEVILAVVNGHGETGLVVTDARLLVANGSGWWQAYPYDELLHVNLEKSFGQVSIIVRPKLGPQNDIRVYGAKGAEAAGQAVGLINVAIGRPATLVGSYPTGFGRADAYGRQLYAEEAAELALFGYEPVTSAASEVASAFGVKAGKLTVTYRLKAAAEATKVCPDCAETVLAAARICRFCRHAFPPPDVESGLHAAQTQPAVVLLVEVGQQKVRVAKLLHDQLGMSLPQALDLIKGAVPAELGKFAARDDAEALRADLEAIGASVEVH